MIGKYVDLDRLLALAQEIPPSRKSSQLDPAPASDVRIGVAYDEAFNFYYADLFDVLASLGAGVVQFSPVHDRLPDADGYIIGGGYPGLFVPELEANDRMRNAIRDVSKNGTPIYAECGGLMYLTDRMVLKEGWQGRDKELSGAMCGVFPGETRMPARRVVSYVEGTARPGARWVPHGSGATSSIIRRWCSNLRQNLPTNSRGGSGSGKCWTVR